MQEELDRLDSWKQIAAYLDKSERTVRRWQETEGLPVHKHQHQQRGSVWAYRQELDAWRDGRLVLPQPLNGDSPDGFKTHRWKPVAAGAAICLIAVAAVLWFLRPSGIYTLPQPVHLTTLPGTEIGVAFSPDGRRMAFHWMPPGSNRAGIYVQAVDSADGSWLISSPETNNFHDYSPAWSPDGKTIAFLRRESGLTGLYVAASSGGPERKLIQVSRRGFLVGDNRHLSWSADSKRILTPITGDDARQAIYWVSASDAKTERLTETANSAFAPVLSPEGTAFVFLRKSATIDSKGEIVLQRLGPSGSASGAPQPLHQTKSLPTGLAWTPDGKDLLICTSEVGGDGPEDAKIYRMRAKPNSRLTPIGGAGCHTLTVSAGRLAYGSILGARTRLHHAQLTDVWDSSEFAPSSRFDGFPQFSPDGASVAFVSTRGGSAAVWIASRDGSKVNRITEESVPNRPVQWSPDGARVLFLSQALGLAVAPVAGGPPSKFPGPRLEPRHIYWYHARDWIYGSGFHLSHFLPDGRGKTLVGRYKRAPIVRGSSDGKTLFIAREFDLVRKPVDGGAEEMIEPKLLNRSIAVSNTALYYFRFEDRALYALPFAGGPARKIGALKGFETSRQFDLNGAFTVSPDDSRIVWTVSDVREVDLEMVPDFR